MTRGNKNRLAVFDCDGTIVDSQHAIIHAMRSAFARFDMPEPSHEAIRRLVGLPLEQAFAILVPQQPATRYEELRTAYAIAWRKIQSDNIISEPLYPGLLAAIEALRQDGWWLGIATGKSRRGLDETLHRHGLSEYFVTLQTADRASGKPHPQMLLQAMDETGVHAEDTVMIGDTTYDMEMSRNARVRAIGVAWGYHGAAELLAGGAEMVLNECSDITATLVQNRESKL